jgi:hypothetical protein
MFCDADTDTTYVTGQVLRVRGAPAGGDEDAHGIAAGTRGAGASGATECLWPCHQL